MPDPAGKTAFFSLSQYSFKEHKYARSEWNLLDLKTGKTSLLTEDSNVSEIIWLGSGTEILYINGTNSEVEGGSELWISDTKSFDKAYKAGAISGPVSGLKHGTTKDGDIKFVLSGQSTADGQLYNPDTAKKQLSTARIYDSIYPRTWSYYLAPEFNAVFSGTLAKKGNKYNFNGKLQNLVAPVKYAECPGGALGGPEEYDISADGHTVAFISKAPEKPKANFTTSYVFTAPHDGSSKAVPINGPDNSIRGFHGASSAPVFSPDNKKLVYFQMQQEQYEADRKVIFIASLYGSKPHSSKPHVKSIAENWDRSPGSVKWTADSQTLYVTAEDRGTTRLFSLPANAEGNYKPRPFKQDGSINSYHFVGDSKNVLVTGATFWASALYYITGPRGPIQRKLLYSNEEDPELKGFGPKDIDEFYVKGHRARVQSWIIKPKGFDPKKKYPLAFILHGGPQGAWTNVWSNRWNFKVWADQGYVVVAPNPTGSTGFGQELTDAIQNDWGGAPYEDLKKIWEYVRDNLDYIDTENGVAAGASSGGWMINWIQGTEFGRKFKALVTHAGIFVAAAMINTDKLWVMEREFNGTYWDAYDNWVRFDPSTPKHIRRFATPHLIIHNDKDYGVDITEGISLFNVLQERGVPSRFLNFPDETHWVVRPENALVWHQQVLGWINKYSGVGKSNPDAVKLTDTAIPVVDIDAGSNN